MSLPFIFGTKSSSEGSEEAAVTSTASSTRTTTTTTTSLAGSRFSPTKKLQFFTRRKKTSKMEDTENEEELEAQSFNDQRRNKLRADALKSRNSYKSHFTRAEKRFIGKCHILRDQGLFQDEPSPEEVKRARLDISLVLSEMETFFEKMSAAQEEVMYWFTPDPDMLDEEDPEKDGIDDYYNRLMDARRVTLELVEPVSAEAVGARQEPGRAHADQRTPEALLEAVATSAAAAATAAMAAADKGGRVEDLKKLMGVNYSVTSDVKFFDGSSIEKYSTFKSQWAMADARMEEIGKSDVQKLQQLKRVLRGQALVNVEDLADNDDNYNVALDILDRIYKNKTASVLALFDRVLKAPEMEASGSSIMKSFSVFNSVNNALQAMNLSYEDLYTLCFISMCSKKLNTDCQKAWLDKLEDKRDDDKPMGVDITIDTFLEVLLRQGRVRQDKEDSKDKKDKTNYGAKPKNNNKTSAPATFATTIAKCVICGGEKTHKAAFCPRLSSIAKDELFNLRAKKKLCYICLEKYQGNHKSYCKGQKCSVKGCGKAHHTLLHKEEQLSTYKEARRDVNAVTPKSEKPKEEEKKEETVMVSCTVGSGICRAVRGFVRNPHTGQKVLARFMLDACATGNLIRRVKAEDLGLNGPPRILTMNVAGGSVTKPTKEKAVEFFIESLDGSYVSPTTVTATTSPVLVKKLAAVHFDPKQFDHLKDINWTEEFPREERSVDVLIGEPWVSYLQSETPIRKGRLHEPAAQHYALGWALCGGSPEQQSESINFTVCATDCQSKPLDLKGLWDLENIGISGEDSKLCVEHELAEEMMSKVTTYDKENKKWTTGMLFKSDTKKMLSDNYKKALGVMLANEKRVNEEDRKMMEEAFQELRERGFVEEVPAKEINLPKNKFVYYLEVRPVFKKKRLTTKCRLTFNAASKDKQTKLTLNDCLLDCPMEMPPIAAVIIQFRSKKVGLLMDLSKMFHSIGMREEDRDSMRFLWRLRKEEKPSVFRFTCLLFGSKTSPYQASWTVKATANMFEEEFKKAVEEVRKTLYMDDYCGGEHNKEEAVDLVRQLVEFFKKANLKAHKFASNDKGIFEDIKDLDINPMPVLKCLGVTWDTEEDDLLFDFFQHVTEDEEEDAKKKKRKNVNGVTMRVLLSRVSKLFDPCGLAGPFILPMKLAMRQLWISCHKWDEELPVDILIKFNKWIEDLKVLRNIKKKRWINYEPNNGDAIDIVTFVDASKDAFATAVFTVVIKKDEPNVTTLVLGRNRVAPKDMKTKKTELTIVRLELLACLIGARASKFVAETLNVPMSRVTIYSDSKINLARLRKSPNILKVWESNRVKEILAKTPGASWNHIPGEYNSADIASRGATATELLESKLWWNGPDFLSKPKELWPKDEDAIASEELEVKEQVLAVKVDEEAGLFGLEKKTNSWWRLIRITAFALRFVRKCREHSLGGRSRKKKVDLKVSTLTVTELKSATDFWLKRAQHLAFSEEIEDLKKSGNVRKSSDISQHTPMMKNGFLVSESRLRLSETLSEQEKFPKILPKHNSIVEKFILGHHVANLHSGTEQTLFFLLHGFRVVGGKREVKRILCKCFQRNCKKPKIFEPKMAPLPTERMDNPVAYQYCSLDFFGPMIAKHDCNIKDCPHTDSKVYACLFTCFQSRHCHVELVHDLSTEAFLEAFLRFVSRRGKPSVMYSDNCKTYKAAAKELNKIVNGLDWNKINDKMTQKSIEWKWSTERAAWTNGLTERLVGLLKYHLRIIFDKNKFTKIQIATILAECEMMVNNRPLSAISESDEVLPVTPSELVTGRKLEPLPVQIPKSVLDSEPKYIGKWKTRRTIQNNFWKKWRHNYLLNLSVTRKWKQGQPILKEKDVVLLMDKNLSRGHWKLGRIEEVIRGRDSVVRQAIVQVAGGGKVKRHLRQLALLEGVAEEKERKIPDV